MTGPFVTLREAAKFCGYKYDSFKKIAQEYKIPKYGPKRTKLSTVDLERFMVEPTLFMSSSDAQRGRNRKPLSINFE